MPIHHSIDDDPPYLIRTVFSGDVSDADVTAHHRALAADPRFESSLAELVDLSNVSDFFVTSHGMAQSAHSGLHNPIARRAFIAPTDAVFGMARMYQSFYDEYGGAQLAVYRSRSAALAWLQALR